MNIILFAPEEFPADAPATLALPRADARVAHILDVLRRKPGDTFDAGLIDGPRGKATLTAILPAAPNAHAAHATPAALAAPNAHAARGGSLLLTFAWEKTAPPLLPPITLVIGLPRPQTARKILNEAASLGVSEMRFIATERGEPSYAQSALWTSGEYRRHLVAGAAQAFCTRIPRVTFGESLAETLGALAAAQPDAPRVALDNYESPDSLSAHLRKLASAPAPLILAFGPERGWSAAERDQLRAAHHAFAHLGARVLRAETAVIAAVTLALARMGRM